MPQVVLHRAGKLVAVRREFTSGVQESAVLTGWQAVAQMPEVRQAG